MAFLYSMRGSGAAPVVLGSVPPRAEEVAAGRQEEVREPDRVQVEPRGGDDALVMDALFVKSADEPISEAELLEDLEPFKMVSVRSSNVAAVGYLDGVLRVRYKSGAVYEYEAVELAVYSGLMAADSVGGMLGKIKGDYVCRRVA